MAFDTPARIAILGAGPIGLEAALYARYLGYEVDIYERGYVAETIRRLGHARLFAPLGELTSTLGVAALVAQEPNWQLPAQNDLPTGNEWVEHYLLPLAQSDLLAPNLHEQHQVLAVGHEEMCRSDLPGSDVRGDYDFQLLVRDSAGHERWASADIVIDATGVCGKPNHMGPGGMPAAGELPARLRIEYELADVLGRDRPIYAGKRILLVGNHDAAAVTLLALEQLALAEPSTTCVWITPLPFTPDEIDGEESSAEVEVKAPTVIPNSPPMARLEQDLFPARDAIVQAANRLAWQSPEWLTWLQTPIRSIQWDSQLGRFRVHVGNEGAAEIEFERVIACVGHRPDHSLSQELPVEFDAVWEAPRKLGAALSSPFDSRRGPAAVDPELLLTSELNFYVLGAKSYGRHPGFHYHAGLEQIRGLFSSIGERANLNLYATAPRPEREQ